MGGLTGKKFADLSYAISDAYPDVPSLKILINQHTNYRFGEYVAEPTTVPGAIDSLIDGAQEDGWIHELIRAAFKNNKTNVPLRNFIRDNPAYDPTNPPPTPLDPYKAYFVHANSLFIGRDELRDTLRQLHAEENSSRIFLVAGARVSGKTYTRFLINYLAAQFQPHEPIYIDLDKFDYQPYDVAVEMAEKMGVRREDIDALPKQQEETADRYVHRLCTRLQNLTVNTNKNWWFVYDGFRKNEIDTLPATKLFIGAWAEIVENEIQRKCYVVLLNYTNFLPNLDLRRVKYEEVKIVDRDDLILFFEHLFEENEKDYSREVVENVVDGIINQTEAKITLDADGDEEKLKSLQEERLKYLSTATSETLEKLVQKQFVI